jgi:hypothetical protein
MRLVSMVVVILVATTGFVQFLANELDQDWLGVNRVRLRVSHVSFNMTPSLDMHQVHKSKNNMHTYIS